MKNFTKVAIGVALGAFAGVLYFHFFASCESGTCFITSSWYKTMAYGGLMGGLAANLYQAK